MAEVIVHRGPDSGGQYLDGPVALAARRLAIIDLGGGDQPIGNEDGSVHVVQNGEIYNYRALRDELHRRGHRFRTESDTEVLVHLYEEHGPRFVEHLRGMFAVAVWDAPRRRLVLGRDRFGIKPLFYRADPGLLTFGSELKCLIAHPDFRFDLSRDALEAYLAFNWIPGPQSIYDGTMRLEAGHVLVAEQDGIRTERYARPAPSPASALRDDDFATAAERTRSVLRDSVEAHLVADVPVGVLLSGGVDSSLLTALAAEATSGAVKTFSIGFEDAAYNELSRAREVAERYGTDHHELVVEPDAVDLLPRIVEALDEPFGDSSALPTYLVAQLASTEVKVALAGEGGDELFGGYYTYAADALARRAGPLAHAARGALGRVPRLPVGARSEDRIRRFAEGAGRPPLDRHCAWLEVLSDDVRGELLGARRGADPLAYARARYAETGGATAIARFQDVDIGTYLVDDLLTKTDRASMAHSLEIRVPFLDDAVHGLALSYPDRYRVRRLQKKRLLREAARPLVPAAILEAPKQGFSIPAAAWLRGELRDFAHDALAPATLDRHGVLSPPAVTRILDEHDSGRRDRSRQLWGLLMLTLWLEAFGPSSARARRPAATVGGPRA